MGISLFPISAKETDEKEEYPDSAMRRYQEHHKSEHQPYRIHIQLLVELYSTIFLFYCNTKKSIVKFVGEVKGCDIGI